MSEPDKMSPHAASSTGCSFQLCIFQGLPQAAGSLVLEERELAFFFHCGGGTRRARVPEGPTARGHPTTTGAPRVLPREASWARGAAAMSPTASYIWYVSG